MTKTSIIDEGAESTVVLTIHNDTTRTITKFQKPEGKTQYLFEAFVYTTLKNLGSHVPTVISATDTKLVMTAFDGNVLDDQVALFTNKMIFDSAAKDLSLNRNVTFEGYGKATQEGDTYKGEFFSWSQFLANTYETLMESAIFSHPQKATLSQKWQELLNSFSLSIDKGALVHGDFAISAIFVNHGVYEGIIDYGDAFIGDPLMDLAYFRFKEITKPYGFALYDTFAASYSNYSTVNRKYIDTATQFYMIYWAIERTHAKNLTSIVIEKFIDKTNALIELLGKQ